MDPLTHTLVGATLARTRLGRGVTLGTPALVLGANLPDVDVLSALAGTDASFAFRRGWTHGPIGLALLPLGLAAALLAWDALLRGGRPERPRARPVPLVALAYVAGLTHPLLDWLNTYGVRWLMPFDDRWFYGDALFIVDPWVWLVLGGALFLGSARRGFPWGWAALALLASAVVLGAGDLATLPVRAAWLLGLVAIVVLRAATSVGARPTATAASGLILVSGYVLVMVAMAQASAMWVRGELARQGVSGLERLMVGPAPARPLRWSVVAETAEGYRYGSLDWTPWPVLDLAPTAIAKPRPSAVLDAARAAPGVRGTLAWMRFPFTEIEETADGYTVLFLDARYVRSRSRGFGTAVVELDRQLRVRAR